MRRTLTKLSTIALVLVFLLSASTALLAQNADQRTTIQLYGSALQYKGDLGNQWWKSDKGWGGGLSVNKYLTPAFDAGLHLSYGKTKFTNDFPNTMDAKLGMAMLGLRLKAYGNILKEDAFIGPYLAAGAGLHFVNTNGDSPTGVYDDKFTAFAYYGGAGFRFRFSDNLSLFIQSNMYFTSSDKYDNIESNDNDRFLQHNLGLGFNLGRGKDTDGDGVSDRKDKCPDTPTGVQVDKDGCPIDTDGDGVPDYQDECPTEAGVANLGGCPDRDGDGIADKDDQCPDEPGTAATQGCPDSDGDGVPDKDDKCPDTPAGMQVGADGCPTDSDGDGVPDDQDICPNSPGTIETKGCPELDAATKKLIEEKVRFEFDQARVQDGYRQLLDSIVVALEKYPDHVLLIKGHADFIGTEEYNQALSERRAQAVKEYLIQRGVQNPDRLVTRGYGETQPLVKVDTRLSKAKTAAARAKNRRVGFEMNTPDMKLNMD